VRSLRDCLEPVVHILWQVRLGAARGPPSALRNRCPCVHALAPPPLQDFRSRSRTGMGDAARGDFTVRDRSCRVRGGPPPAIACITKAASVPPLQVRMLVPSVAAAALPQPVMAAISAASRVSFVS
jgi:hypothetical protein